MGTPVLLNTNPGLRLFVWLCGSARDVALSLRTQSDIVKRCGLDQQDPIYRIGSEPERGLQCDRGDREYADDWIGQRML